MILTCLTLALAAQPATSPAIIPAPAVMTLRKGSFRLDTRTRISASGQAAAVAEHLRSWLRPATGLALPIESRAGRDSITLTLGTSAAKLGPEGYTLDVDAHSVRITAFTTRGLFYGAETLRQLLPTSVFRHAEVKGVDWTVPAIHIEDQPRFAWRGAMMDSSRHFMPKEAVLKFLDVMAVHKLNSFHWHLVDDNGWRIEIKQYPKLTELGSSTDFSAMNPKQATRSRNQAPGGFYTQDDIREVVQYAADRFINVVPEIEMPGHSAAAILAYPELGNFTAIQAAGKSISDLGADNVLNTTDTTQTFMKNVLAEVMGLFPSKFIHVGGDEVWKEPWKRSPEAQAHMKDLGVKTEEELQSWFIQQMDHFLTAHNRRLIGWDEILEGGLAPGAAVMSWRGIDGGISAAKAGHDVVMAPTSHTYFDYYQAQPSAGEPLGIGGYVPLKKVYSFEPIPSALTASEAKHVLGLQFQLWAEFIPHPRHLEYMAYPRGCALSEVGWSPATGRNYDEFMGRLRVHLERLKLMDVNYRPLDTRSPNTVGAWKSGDANEKFTTKTWDLGKAITAPGTYAITFQYTEGDCRLDVEWAELTRDGIVIERDSHPGRAGGESQDNVYTFHVKDSPSNAAYTLRASVRADGGTDSNGEIYIAKVG